MTRKRTVTVHVGDQDPMLNQTSEINLEASVAIIGRAIEESEHAYLSRRKKHQRMQLKVLDSICYLTKGSVSIFRLENNLLCR